MAREQEIGAYSAYAIAVKHGYVGTEEDWIEEQERNRKASEQAASDAESAKTAAEKAQKAAESSASGAAGEAQKAQTSAAQAAGSAAQAAEAVTAAGEAQKAAGEAQKAAESAKSAAEGFAAAAQESKEQAASSAESADSAKTAAAQSEQRTAASEVNVAQAEERINKTVSGAVAAVAAQEQTSVAAVTAEGERVLGTIPEDYTTLSNGVSQLKDDLADLTAENEEKKTRMENPEHHAGYWWDGEHANDSYFYVKLSVNAGDVICAINTLNNNIIAVRFVDAYSGANRVGDASSTNITEYTVPAAVDTLYLSINTSEDTKDYIQIEITEITVIKSIIIPFNKNGIMTKTSSLENGYVLTACKNFDVKKNQSYRFYARFDTFDSLCVCHGYNTYGGSWIEVGATNITAYYYNGSSAVQMGQWAHGLSISDFIEVIVNVDNAQNLRAKVTVMSETGDFIQDNVPMGGCTGGVSAFGRQKMTDVYFSYSIGDLSTDVWLFGDSYTSLGDPNRWTHKLMDYGYKNLLMSGFSGATSADQIKSFRNLISIGRPKYLVWALGMNDSDTDGAVNTSWKESFDEVSAWCNLNKIQFIACTIPNTPRVRNVEKNEIVRLSGYRYVDFAKAVNAEEVGSTWYPGMLSTDDVHPIELGAKVLANRFLVDVPEVMG